MPPDAIHHLFAAIDARRWDCLAHFFAKDIVYERPGYEPILGLAELERFYRDVRIVAAGQHDLAHVVTGGRFAACWGRFTGQSRLGDPLDERFADVYQIRGGLISSRTTYFFRPAI